MYIRKSKGPSTEPCGTPRVIFFLTDDSPFRKTYCCLSFK